MAERMTTIRTDREYAPGERIPGTEYVVIGLVARGGHGALYLVRHYFLEKKIYMLKTLRALEPSSDLAERLTREAKMLAGINHPHIVSVVSGGITDEPEPRPYFVMERLQGCSLASIQGDTPEGVGIDVALQILIEMCDALGHIHERGVIHRDVKPDNIFLERAAQGAGSNTKLLDFGVMHVLSGDKRQASEEGMFIGTFRYAAPEQLFGKLPTAQTDIYALGLVGYEAITGRHPFAFCTTDEEVSKAHIATEPPPFPDVPRPEGLEALIMHMLRKKPAERPTSAKWLAVQLRQIRLDVEVQRAGFSPEQINQTHPSPVQNRLTMTRAEATDPGEPPEEAEEQPPEPVVSTAPETPRTQWLNQAATVERPAAPFNRATEDSSEGSSWSFLAKLSPDLEDAAHPAVHDPPSSFSPSGVERNAPTPPVEQIRAPLERMRTEELRAKAASHNDLEGARWAHVDAGAGPPASADPFDGGEEDDRYQESEFSGLGTRRPVASAMPARAITSASNGVALPASRDDERYRQIELRNAAQKARISSHLRARTMARASNAVAVAKPSRRSLVDRLIRNRPSLAAGVATSFVLVASYAYFSERKSHVSDSPAAKTAHSEPLATPRTPTPLPALDRPIDVPPPSAPVSPAEPASLPSPFAASPPPAQNVARPSPAPQVARPSPPQARHKVKGDPLDDLDTSPLFDDPDGAATAHMKDDFVHDDLDPSPPQRSPPVARSPPARSRPVAAPMKDDFIRDPL